MTSTADREIVATPATMQWAASDSAGSARKTVEVGQDSVTEGRTGALERLAGHLAKA